MQNIRVIGNSDICAGCDICRLVCSIYNEGLFQPSMARLLINRNIFEGSTEIITCHQCKDFPCSEACPSNAFIEDKNLGIMVINQSLCTGCKLCLEACPYNVIKYDSSKGVVVKCDLCKSIPKCVESCPMGALRISKE